jgi:hypothetical protein
MKDIVTGRDVLLIGGSPTYEIPEIKDQIIVRINNHHLWQTDPMRCPDGPSHTDGVYHGAGLPGLIAMFMNVPPDGLRFICQQAGTQYRNNMEGWAKMRGIKYFPYGTCPAERLERGVDPAAFEPVFKPLLEICKFPFTGVVAAFHLLTLPIKSLALTGFDFYRSSHYTHKDNKRGEHEISHNKKAMEMILGDSRARPDRILQDSLR